jgi:hypothetical protein
MGMLSLGINGSRPREPPTETSRIARGIRGYTHRVRSRAPSDQGVRPSLSTPLPLLRARGLARASGSQSARSLNPIVGSCPAYDASQSQHTLIHRGSGAPRCRPASAALSTTPPTRSCMGRDTRRHTPLWPPGARRLPRPHVSPSTRPPSPPRSLQKAHLGEASPSRHSLTCRVSEQSSRTMPRASSAPRHRHSPQSAATGPS